MSNENETLNDFDPNWDEEDSSWEMDWNWDGGSSWIWGVLLVLGGALLLAQNLFDFRIVYLHNWWAIFILIPGLQTLSQVWRSYKENGRLTAGAQKKVLSGFFLTALALTFFLNIGWQIVGPAFLILFGLFLLFFRK